MNDILQQIKRNLNSLIPRFNILSAMEDSRMLTNHAAVINSRDNLPRDTSERHRHNGMVRDPMSQTPLMETEVEVASPTESAV